MNFKEEYQNLVKSVKSKALAQGKRLKNADIALKLGYNTDYFATLVGKTGKVTKDHIEDFKSAFRDELENIKKPEPGDQLNDERVILKALLFEVANLKADKENISFDEAVKAIKKNTNLVKALDIDFGI